MFKAWLFLAFEIQENKAPWMYLFETDKVSVARGVTSCNILLFVCCSPDSKYNSTSTQSNILVGFKNRLLHKLPAFSLHSLMHRVAVCNIQQTVMNMKHISDFQPRLIHLRFTAELLQSCIFFCNNI